MFKRIDESGWLAKRIASLSEFMAKRRGLPVVIGIVLIIISFVIQLIDVYAVSQPLRLIGVITLNVGILTSLIGLLLADPLGK
ncbi:MAG: hypothetical protein LCI00_03615 [Chloroflexi bacterium]|nr:hypothetical protein [Chloroflexota bacterium]MCC6891289.1 hypothetical protein [Anaerolineae bacterium]